MRIALFLFILTFDSYLCQLDKTIYESLQTYSPSLYHQMQGAGELIDLFDQSNYNITFLLPNEVALNISLETGLLNFSAEGNVYAKLGLMTLNGTFANQVLLSDRNFYKSITNQYLSIGPHIVNNKPTNNIQVYSGMTKALTASTEIQCSNGVILFIDNFLQPAETPLTTISNLPETEYMEGLLKSLNVSDTISRINTTILVPINEAWESVNGSSIPFGTLVHNLKYSVLDGIYTLDKIIRLLDTSSTTSKSIAIATDYKKDSVHFQLDKHSNLIMNGNTLFVKTDILTSTGVVHLIDHVLLADTFEPNQTQSTTTTSASPMDSPPFTSNNTTILLASFNYLTILLVISLIYIL
ncbi:FAS1 domain-containing protein [Helicostylum pulchrum]|nr:FAS1 domain-containing protein [Helicostylum pulchrum]